MSIYLAGPIYGCSDAEARGWREAAQRGAPHLAFLDPLRRDFRGYETTSARAIVGGDLRDIAEADKVLAFAKRPSWGTAMEIVYARILGKRIVAVADFPASPWLTYHAHVMCDSLDAALEALEEMA